LTVILQQQQQHQRQQQGPVKQLQQAISSAHVSAKAQLLDVDAAQPLLPGMSSGAYILTNPTGCLWHVQALTELSNRVHR
jgi:hypothetical protein